MRSTLLMACLLLNALLTGCASKPYQYGYDTNQHAINQQLSPVMESQFLYGKPHRFLDAADWYWPGSLLSKLFLWNKEIDSHEISTETVDYLKAYLEANQLGNVQVLVNSYSVGNQWHRLRKNKTVHPFWRYTFGALSVAYYTAFPGRFFGGDAYNPYTNTIYLYSDDISVALHEAGHAKDTARRKNKGLHAFLYQLPFAALYYEAVATSDALGYLEDQQLTEDEKEAYRTLHPAYATYLFGNIWRGQPAAMLGTIPGHIAGNIAAARLSAPLTESQAPSTQLKTEPVTTSKTESSDNSMLSKPSVDSLPDTRDDTSGDNTSTTDSN